MGGVSHIGIGGVSHTTFYVVSQRMEGMLNRGLCHCSFASIKSVKSCIFGRKLSLPGNLRRREDVLDEILGMDENPKEELTQLVVG